MEVTFMAARKVVDCRLFPNANNCTLTIAGTAEEALKAAVEHAVSSHGHTDTPELREQLRAAMQDEEKQG
jgi:predicted small metal-binding protein